MIVAALLGVLGVGGLVYFAYTLGYDKGVWQCYYNSDSKRVREIIADETNFWFHY